MRRYLLVLDTDLRARDGTPGLGPINYLAEQQAQQPCDVVVLSLAATRQAKLSPLELVLGAASGSAGLKKYPTAPQPGHDIGAAAEHRMNRAVHHLKTIGCQANGIISDQDLVKAVDAETRIHDYDEVILAATIHDDSWLARTLHVDPIHHLQRRWGKRLTVFTTSPGSEPDHR